MVDLSILLLVDDDANFLARTIQALEEATAFGSLVGISFELIVASDESSAETAAIAERTDRASLGVARVARVLGSSPRDARSRGLRAASGEFVAILRGRDIVSYDALASFVETARAARGACVVVPSFVLTVGARCSLLEQRGSREISTLAFATDPLYSSVAVVRRDALALEVAERCDHDDFVPELFASGAEVVVAPHTIVFDRPYPGQTVTRSWEPGSRRFDPAVFRARTRDAYERRVATGSGVAGPRRRSSGPVRRFLTSEAAMELTSAATEIDPGINVNRFPSMTGRSNASVDDRVGAAFHALCDTIPGRDFADVFLLPFLTKGGADRYVLDVMNASTARSGRAPLVLCGEPIPNHAWLERLPAGTVFVDLVAAASDLADDERLELAALVVRGCERGTRLHLRQSKFADAFYDRFAGRLEHYPAYFYRFCDPTVVMRGRVFEAGSGSEFISAHLGSLAGIISDHHTNVAVDRRRFAVSPAKWHTLPSKIEPAPRVREPIERSALRVLWASRLDRQKRPELLVGIARRLVERGDTRVAIDVYGTALLDHFDVSELDGHPNLRHRGSFPSIASTEPHAYDVFLYTSSHDGIPVVLLETGAAGLPAIAPAIGGIPEIVVDDETGVLLATGGSDGDLVERYVEALLALADDRARIDRYSIAVRERVERRHGPAAFTRAFEAIFPEVLR